MDCASCGTANPPGHRFCGGCGQPLAPRCPVCGTESAPGMKFCGACGASLAGAAAAPATADTVSRKVVTIVFADLIGSTALQERLDAEAVSRVMDRYHRAVRTPIEAHGGTVVQLLGDGVMCAFGVPHVAEDDAIRAVRAAVAVQQAFREFREQNQLTDRVGLRVAVNTGEVVVSDDYAAGIGDPLNVAAHLQAAAHDGDVLIGESTRRLVSELITLAPIGALALKGRSEAVAAYRVVSLDRPAGASATPFVGREGELRRLRAVYDAAVSEQRAKLAVILGSPGLGKSRVLGEVARRLEDGATVISARCDPSGGGTFSPLARGLRALLRIEDTASAEATRAAIEDVLPREEAERDRIAGGIGALLAGTPAPPEETFFVVRRFLGAFAAAAPVVLALDDLHWAEPLLLDLTEHLVQWSTDSPLLVLVAARPELREERSSLATPGPLVSEVVTLAGLDAGAATRLAANAIGAEELPAAVAGRVLAASEGNPLFVGELVRMLVHDGALVREGDHWTLGVELASLEMPPTIQALLAARIEKLRPEERTVLERAAVVGRQFSRAAVKELLPREAPDLDRQLEALRRSELVESDTGWFLGEPALRFHHALIRDAAYRRLLRNTRAELHARFADWVVKRVGDEAPHDETIGWHLEQAHQHLRELGTIDEQGRALGERASRYLAGAGRRALARDDVPVAASLLGRALERLEPADPARADLALDWCEALLAAGEVGTAGRAIDELGRFTADSPRLAAWHTCFAGERAALTDPKSLRGTADAVAAAAEQLTAAGDAAGEAKAHFVHAIALARLGKVGACEAALDRALAAARRVGDRRRANAVLSGAPLAALWGPSPVTRASGRCLDVVRVLRITSGSPAVEAVALRSQGVLEALRGRSEAARRMIASSRRMVEELGITHRLLQADQFAGQVELIEGDPVAAERCLRTAYDGMRELGLGSDAAQCAAQLGRALLAQDRAAEAEAISHESEALAGDDLQSAIAWRGVRAEALARRGEAERAVELARAAVEIASATDALLFHADARLALAAALRASGRGAEAAAEEARATSLWEAKGATLLVERARREGAHAVEPVAPAPVMRVASARAVRRRVRENAATAAFARLEAAVGARDEAAVSELHSDGFHAIHHPTGTEWGRAEGVKTIRGLMRAENLSYRNEPLATLGDSLALGRPSISASGIPGRLSIGPYEMEEQVVIEVDARGRQLRAEFFKADRLGDAITRLYERYAELLPEGPERVRATATARGVAAWFAPTLDPDRFEQVLAAGVEFVDHRRLIGLPSARNADEVRRGIRVLYDTVSDVHLSANDVLVVTPNALLSRITAAGTNRASGGPYDRQHLHLWLYDADGRLARIEWFDVDDEADALARFDALTGVAPRPTRRVRANTASVQAARQAAAIMNRDIDTLAAQLAEDSHNVDHPTGHTYDRAAQLATMRSVMQNRDLVYRNELLATLGERLALCRVSLSAAGLSRGEFDVGAFGGEEIVTYETNASGLFCRSEAFAIDHLGDALSSLYERYAELLPEGVERDRAAAIAYTVAAMGGWDPDRYAAAYAPSFELVDHRRLATVSARGRDAALEIFRSWFAVAYDMTNRITEIFAAQPDMLVVNGMFAGIARDGGGIFEAPCLSLMVFGTDGLQTRLEIFELEDEAAALARFDALAAATPVARRWRANAATEVVARLTAAIEARDEAATLALHAESFVAVHHPTGLEWDRSGVMSSAQLLWRAQDFSPRTEPLATLGDSLALVQRSISTAGLDWDQGEVGPSALENFVLCEVDPDGRFARAEVFASDHLGNAIGRIYERHAELLPEGPERTRAATIARHQTWGSFDPEHYASSMAPGVEMTDHRILGLFAARGSADMLSQARSWTALGDELAVHADELLDLRATGCAFRATLSGVAREGGGAFEMKFISLLVYGADGLVTHFDIFDVDRRAEALARFEALTAAPPARRVRPNAATAYEARLDAAIAAGDADALSELLAEDDEVIEHWTGATHGRSESLAFYRKQLRVQNLARRYEPLATLGDSLALCWHSVSGSGAAGKTLDVGAFQHKNYQLSEVDSQHRRHRLEVFPADHLGDAIVRLYERYAERCTEAPERTRAAAIARSVAVMVRERPDRWPLAPAIERIDHRTVGVGTVRGADELVRAVRAFFELVDDFEWRWEDIVALRPDALIVRITNVGTLGASGGDFERQLCQLWTFGPDGLLNRWEDWEPEQSADALARLDALTSPPARPARRVRPNAATADAARFEAAMRARDAAAIAAHLADSGECVDHPTGTNYAREQSTGTWLSLARAEGGTYRGVPLATLGDSLALCRMWCGASGIVARNLDIGAYEIETVLLVEVDASGRRRHTDNFASDRLGDGIARLYERYAELQPEGPARMRAGGIARSIAATLGPHLENLDTYAPDVAFRDHRAVISVPSSNGIDEVRRRLQLWYETVDDAVTLFDDILDLRSNAVLVRARERGRDRASSGDYEIAFLLLQVYDAEGRRRVFEIFDADREADALARFDALTAERTRPARRIRPNAATDHAARMTSAYAARDLDAIIASVTETWETVDHTTGATFGLQGLIASSQHLLSAEGPVFHLEPLATLGDSLALSRRSVRGSGFVGRRFDVGPYESEMLQVIEAESGGRARRVEVFAADRLGDAIARLYERYAELAPEGPERARAAALAARIRAFGTYDPETYPATLAPDIQFIDHRILGTSSARGADAVMENLRSWSPLADELALGIDDVLGLRPDAFLTRGRFSGIGRESGGPFERGFLTLVAANGDGLMSRFEVFDDDREVEALARFDALSAPPAPARLFETAATRAVDRFDRAWAARDWQAVAGHNAPGLRYSDRRALMQLELDHEQWIEFTRPLFEMEVSRISQEVLATRGDRLVLTRMRFEGSDGSIGPSETESLGVAEVDDRGDRIALVRFDPDQLDAAYAELDARYAAGEAAEHPAEWAVSSGLGAAFAARDWERYRAFFSPDAVVEDHRILGLGSSSAINAVASVRAMSELRPDAALRYEHIALTDRGVLIAVRWVGSESEGAFELPAVVVLEIGADGRIRRWDAYDPEQIDAARARFAELAAPRAPACLFENTATQNRFLRAWVARDWEAVVACHAPGLRYEDRRSLMRLDLDRDEYLAFIRPLFDMQVSRLSQEWLATRGDRLALTRLRWEGSDGALGPSETESLTVAEVDERGDRIALVRFDADALDAAYAELDRRYAEGEAAEHPAMWARSSGMGRAIASRDWDQFASFFSPDFVRHDHQLLGTGRARSLEKYVAGVRALVEMRPDAFTRRSHMALADRAALIVTSWLGRESEGAFEIPYVLVHEAGPDGRIVREDAYDPEQIDAARARFAELAAPPRLFENAATRAEDRLARAWNARDWEAVVAGHRPGSRYFDRRALVQLELDHEQWIEFTRPLFEMSSSRLSGEPLATRGNRLSLAWVRFEGADGAIGTSEIESLAVVEVDARGERTAMVRFDLAALDAAYAELDARYAAGEAAEHPETQAVVSRLARAIRDRAWDALTTVFSEHLVARDHRPLSGWETMDSAHDYIARIRSMWDLRPDATLRVSHIDVAEGVALAVSTWIGSEAEGAFEIPHIFIYGIERGRIASVDCYDLDHQLDAARARFAELAAPRASARLIETTATRTVDRFGRAWAARDWQAICALNAPELRYSDRRALMQLELDRETFHQFIHPLLEMEESRVFQEVLATRGDRLVLTRMRFEGSDGSIGPSETESLSVAEVDEHGNRIALVRFDPDKLDDAYAELGRRFLAGEAAAFPAPVRWMQMFGQARGAPESDMGAYLAPDFVVHDHSPLGWGTLDRATYIESMKALNALSADTRIRPLHVWLCERGLLRIGLVFGTHEGGAFEQLRVAVFEVDAEGQEHRRDVYALDQLDDARARFAELQPDPLRIPPNAATRLGPRLEEAHLAGDWDAVAALCAPTLEFDDRRRAALLKGDRDMFVASLRFAGPAIRRFNTVLATAGDRLALIHQTFQIRTDGTDVPGVEAEVLSVVEADSEGRMDALVVFDPDDRRAATRELFEREARLESLPAGVVAMYRARLDRDLAACRAALPDEYVFDDHRRTGLGRIEKDEYIASLAALFEQSPDTIFGGLYTIAREEHGFLGIGRRFGTLAEGGEYESIFVALGHYRGGRIVREENFELEDLDVARARFEELRPDPLRIPPNAATRAVDRIWEYYRARAWDDLRALCAPMVFEDRRRQFLTTGDCEMFIENSKLMAATDVALSRTRLATAGDRLTLEKMLWTWDAGAFEIENLHVVEVDSEGHVVAIITFDLDDRHAAFAEMWSRFVPERPVRARSLGVVAFNEHDWEALRSSYLPDAVIHDHRPLSLGVVNRDEYVESVRAWAEMAPDLGVEMLRFFTRNEHGAVFLSRAFGTIPDGGPFENYLIGFQLFEGDRIRRYELYPVDAADEALARFAELCAERE